MNRLINVMLHETKYVNNGGWKKKRFRVNYGEKQVFPKINTDKASLIGKTDDYLCKHQRPHIVMEVSNKIRELVAD